LLLCQLFCWTLPVAAQVQVVSSIKPLQLIAAAVTEDISLPELVIGPGQDPHHLSLRPSERRILAAADVLLWVGPALEQELVDIIEELNVETISSFALLQTAGRDIGESIDPHMWLSTQHVRLIAQVLARRLQTLDESNRAAYANNLNRFLLSMDELDGQIEETLEGLQQRPFAVYHNAFWYFEQQFGLSHLASVTENEELQPGVRKIIQTRKTLEEARVNCLLIQPQHNSQKLRQLLGRSMHITSIDVLGHDYPLSSTAYADFMRDLSKAIAGCLSG
jgi:zinc transport system substrate-binding protein